MRTTRVQIFSLLVATLAVAVFASGCYQVPVTGRRTANLVDNKQVTKMSVAAFNDLKKRHRPSRDRARIEQLNRIGERLSKVVFWEMPDAEWEFVVFDDPKQINAFAMAGGKVGVFSGLYRIIENDDQLASVLAHEIAHVTAKHIHQRLSQELLVNTGAVLGTVALLGSGADGYTAEAVQGLYGLGTGVTGLAFDRAKEKEADKIGLIYMARAGYNPEEAIAVIDKLDSAVAAEAKNAPPTWLSTHPSNPQRILELREAMPEALEVYKKSGQTIQPVLVR